MKNGARNKNLKSAWDKKKYWAGRDSRYQKILCPEFPPFLEKYLSLKILARLKDIGLLCGTDWTPLFKNRFYYSRFEHSVNCALIVWNWTHSKRETVAALLHDVSTPLFSHVIDFKNGDALKQESTEDKNAAMIHGDAELAAALEQDGLSAADVDDYHRFPICDNEVPRLSADRLEYMFPSGAALDKIFSLREVKRVYDDLTLCTNEDGMCEFAFKSEKTALLYFRKTLHIGYLLQHNEDKMAMQLLAHVVNLALECGAISESELYSMSEKKIIERWDAALLESQGRAGEGDNLQDALHADFLRHYKTFRNMKKITRGTRAIRNHFNVRLDVKRRYINPLVLLDDKHTNARLCSINAHAEKMRIDFLNYNDAPYASVPLVHLAT